MRLDGRRERSMAASAEAVSRSAGPMSYRQGIRFAMNVLNGEWPVEVLASLAAKPMTYTGLLEAINSNEERVGWTAHPQPISQKVLSATLLRMRRDGLVARSREAGPFSPAWYRLSPIGETLLRALRPLAKWSVDNNDSVAEARARYEDAGSSDES